MTTKNQGARKTASRKTAKKAAPKRKAPAKAQSNATAHVTDPCAAGHTWETDAEGVEHCTVCLADRKVIEWTAGEKSGKVNKTKKAKPANAAAITKPSALDAAAQVLASSAESLNTKQMIEQMATKGLWTSPGGKTPHATLYSAILREIQVKGKEARFKKTDRGHFKVNG